MVPYVGHLLGVASLVIDACGSEDEAIAALLHDAAEDQGGPKRLEDIRTRFGNRVAVIVEGCSDSLVEDPRAKAPWLQRKRAYIAHLRANTDPSVHLISAADKLHNAESMLSDFRVVGDALWGRFSPDGGRDRIIWNFRELIDAYRHGPIDARRDPIVRRLADVVDRLEAVTSRDNPTQKSAS
jgi:GTP pyrophosphokinase